MDRLRARALESLVICPGDPRPRSQEQRHRYRLVPGRRLGSRAAGPHGWRSTPPARRGARVRAPWLPLDRCPRPTRTAPTRVGAPPRLRVALSCTRPRSPTARSQKYQCIVPTTWNGSPKDGAGNERGAIEEAMIGAPFIRRAGARVHQAERAASSTRYHSRWRRGPAYCPVLRSVHRVRDPLTKAEVISLKRFSLVFCLVLALSLVFVGSAFANFGPHGGYATDTDSCAGCHRAHTSFSTVEFDAERSRVLGRQTSERPARRQRAAP